MTLAQLLGLLGSLFFLGQALTAMLVYVWSRRSPRVRVNFFGLLTFQAPFLPWALMGFSMLLGNSILVDLLGEPAVHPAFPKQAVRDLRVCLARAPRPPALDLSSVPTASSCPHGYPVLPAPQTSQRILLADACVGSDPGGDGWVRVPAPWLPFLPCSQA